MPEPGIDDRNFDRPTTGREKPRPNSRPRLKLPKEYAEFRLEDGRYLGDIMGPDFFGPESRRVTEEQREKLREGNYPLAQMVRENPGMFAPRPQAKAVIPYRDGATLPPVLSPRYYRDPVAPAGELESRVPLEEPTEELQTRSRSERISYFPLPRPAEAESDIARMLPNRDRGYPDKWAEKGWGGPRGLYSVPTLNNGGERTANILADKPARFDIRVNPEADPSDPWYASTLAGDAAISSYGPVIEKEARRQGVDPDLAKAIAYSENARGHYFGSAKAAEGLDMADSFLPMNINPSIWGGLGIDRKSASDYLTNIRAGITLIKRISDRIDDPTPEKVASIWNFTGRELVNDFGAYVGRMYLEKPWED